MKKKIRYRATLVLLVSCILYSCLPMISYAADIYPSDAKSSPAGPVKKQTVTKSVSVIAPARPGIYWYQLDKGIWQADRNDNSQHWLAENIGGDCNDPLPIPAATTVTDKINMGDYGPGKNGNTASYKDLNGNWIPMSAVENTKINPLESEFIKEGVSYSSKAPLQIVDNVFLIMQVETGGSYTFAYNRPNGKKRPNGCNKHEAMYPVDMELKWEGTAKETKEIRVKQDSTMKVGETKNFTAEIRTKDFEQTTLPIKWADVTTRTETSWSSDNKSVATVDANGKVTAVKEGTANIIAQWKSVDNLYWLVDSAKITVGKDTGGGKDPSGVCTDPTPSGDMAGAAEDPSVSAVIKADQRGSELFNVLQGIPTSESLYGNVLAKNYLFKNKFVKMTGKCTYNVPVTQEYNMKWTETVDGPPDKDGKPTKVQEEKTDSKTVTKEYQVERPYSFWKIENLEVYQIQEASLSNYALPNERISMNPSGYTPPSYSASTGGTNYTPPPEASVTKPPKQVGKDVPDEDFKGDAEKAIGKVKVQNDSLIFNGQTIMDNRQSDESTFSPGQIPAPQQIGNNVLYSPNNVISNSLTNKKDTPSSGTIAYALMPNNINGGSDKNFQINGINTVTVHTPVVDYSLVSDDRDHNQKTKPNMSRSAFILDRPFTVTIPTVGTHQSYLNYGHRDYAKWTKDRQVRFEFDVLSRLDDNSSYIPAGTWVSYPVGKDTLTFYTPVWVDEGDYNVYTRAIAENAPTGFTTETDANMSWQNHVATRTLPVEVIGRLYDFRITDIADYNWEKVFRKNEGSSTPTGNKYPVGDKGIDGDPNGFSFPYELPIRRGSHPLQGYKNVSVKLGYHFKFDFKSKGNLFDQYDSIRITPSFSFVDMTGARQPVDLYYTDVKNPQYFIKVGSSADVQKRNVALAERLRNVPVQTINDTTSSLKNLFGSIPSWWKPEKPTYVGGYNVELITAPLRTFIGGYDVPAGVNSHRKNAGVQQWYSEYSLPAESYVVPRGTNLAEYARTHKLDDKSSVFLKKGFIVVNFDIETIRNGDLNNPHLQYIRTGIPNANQWKREGFNYQIIDPYGMKVNLYDGDVVFYNADKSSKDDFGNSGTH